MKKNLIVIISISCLLLAAGAAAQQQKLAQTGMKFLSVSTDARASAMGNAFTAIQGTSASMFFNPSAMAELTSTFDVALGQIDWIAGIQYNFGSFALSPANGRYGVFGISAVFIDYGDFNGTIKWNNEQGFIDIGKYSPSAEAIGIGYAKALSTKFSIGGNIKHVKQSLGAATIGLQQDGTRFSENNETTVAAFDFGILYHTGFKSLNFGMNVRNFSKEIEYVEEGFQLPLTFRVGISLNVLDLSRVSSDQHRLFLSMDAVHNRDYQEQMNVGAEYVFMNIFALRAGYVSPTDEEGLSFGLGVKQSFRSYNLAFDYAYTDFGVFEDVQRFTAHFAF